MNQKDLKVSSRSILIIEDDDLIRESLFEVISRAGYEVASAANGKSGLQILREREFGLALVDLRLPDMAGLDVLREIKDIVPQMDVMMMTGYATVETAVEAMRRGALDYLTKPINDDELYILIKRVFQNKELREENTQLKEELSQRNEHFHNIIGANPVMQRIFSIIRATVNTDTTVLLRGESGTGKGLIARAIHDSSPARKEGPYIEVSCGAIPRDLLESELFGHIRGAFTNAIRDRIGRFELANGGTILLDEIDALSPYLQVKLLRILQQKTFERVGEAKTRHTDVRIIAATNRDLAEEIKQGRFREDLYYRLNVISINIPPLRERKDDLPALVAYFLNKISDKIKRNIRSVTDQAMELLLSYDWPGNVRELENSLERAAVLTQNEVLDTADFSERVVQNSEHDLALEALTPASLKENLKEPEKKIILRALEETGWNRKKAALLLNINRTTLYNKMKEHRLM